MRTKQQSLDLLNMLGCRKEELESLESLDYNREFQEIAKQINTLILVADYLTDCGGCEESGILLKIAEEKIEFLKNKPQ